MEPSLAFHAWVLGLHTGAGSVASLPWLLSDRVVHNIEVGLLDALSREEFMGRSKTPKQLHFFLDIGTYTRGVRVYRVADVKRRSYECVWANYYASNYNTKISSTACTHLRTHMTSPSLDNCICTCDSLMTVSTTRHVWFNVALHLPPRSFSIFTLIRPPPFFIVMAMPRVWLSSSRHYDRLVKWSLKLLIWFFFRSSSSLFFPHLFGFAADVIYLFLNVVLVSVFATKLYWRNRVACAYICQTLPRGGYKKSILALVLESMNVSSLDFGSILHGCMAWRWSLDRDNTEFLV